MAEVKRISDQYTISAPAIFIDGNLTVTGTTTTVNTQDSDILDNTIVLNKGEIGPGITHVSQKSGIEIDRGSGATNVSIVYNDSVDAFQVLEGTGLTNIRVATPVNINDAATKQYVDSLTSSAVAGGINGSVQYNNSGTIVGDSVLLWDGTNLTAGNTSISSNSITVDDTNGDLQLSGNGSGTIYTRSVVKMENETSDPSSVSGHNQLYAKTPDSGGTGLYFANDTASGELVSKSKAIVFGIIF